MPNRLKVTLLSSFCALLVLGAAPAFADVVDESGEVIAVESADAVLKNSGLDKIIDRSDYVVHARVGRSTSAWVNGNIETTTAITVEQKLKGDGPDKFELTVLGGKAPDGAPFSQYVRGAARVFEGEEVVLFLRTDTQERLNRLNATRASNGQEAMRISPNSRLATSFAVTGGTRGKFNVITLENGSKMVTRLRPMPHILTEPVVDAMLDRTADKISKGELAREERIEREWDVFADTIERQTGVRPKKPDQPRPETGPDSAAARAARQSGERPRPENTAHLDDEAYSPSVVTDPDAPQFKPTDRRAVLNTIPYNADMMGRPMALETFSALVTYRQARTAAAAVDTPAEVEDQ